MAGREFEDRIRLGSLYRMYGPLLTEKQRTCTELYFYDDLSLSEIADGMKISRQAVSDLLRRVKESLEHDEELLGFLKQSEQASHILNEADTLLQTAETSGGLENIPRVRRLLGKLNSESR